jgi:phosphatidylglycerophosphate synthase
VIDGLWRDQADAFWDRCGRVCARLGMTANGVTLAAVALSLANSGAYVVHRNALAFGVLLALTELLDNLDGAVARVCGTRSRAGSFLDAVTDRYKEAVSLFAVACVNGYWVPGFVAVTGSLIVSYNHARAAMEGAPARAAGPDLFERFERVATLVLGLVLQPLLPKDVAFGRDALYAALLLLGVASHVTALQRLLRGWRQLRKLDQPGRE